jgi:hypothetical protein
MTGGYLNPLPQAELPKRLDVVQFIQTVLVGLSELDGTLVRPKWQVQPPKQPDILVDWISFGINVSTANANAFVGIVNDKTIMQRHEKLEITCSFYGPNAFNLSQLVRDGFQIQQNLDGLRSANMGFTETAPATHLPELINERWVNRYDMNIFLQREVQSEYPIYSFLSVNGTINTALENGSYLLAWKT